MTFTFILAPWAAPRAEGQLGVGRPKPLKQWTKVISHGVFLSAVLSANGCAPSPADIVSEPDPAEVAAGERLFLETRFAQFFQANADGEFNAPLLRGDGVMDTIQTSGASLPGPFRGTSMNCRQCHLVDDAGGDQRVRAYADFAQRSPVPDRGDGRTHTLRNAPTLVNASVPRDVTFALHFDGEFASAVDLAKGGLTGRNFGWLPNERATAVAHIADVVRRDDGRGALAQQFGGLSYATLLNGTSRAIPSELLLPREFRLDVESAQDEEILNLLGRLIAAYMATLTFQQDESGRYSGSPYDAFLEQNGLPRSPDPGESAIAYARRLRAQLDQLEQPSWVTESAERRFRYHSHPFVFGDQELEGLKIFLAEPTEAPPAEALPSGGIGNCLACHAPPHFSDFGFHNTGVAQEEYDDLHGSGAFAALVVPSLAERSAEPEAYLPASAQHPEAPGPFAAIPSAERPGQTDLGLWNVFANPAMSPPAGLDALLRSLPEARDLASDDQLLPLTLARFKTSTLRDLGQAGPYFHTGRARTLEAAIGHYATVADATRSGDLRNADPALSRIALTNADLAPLAAFLRALDEDYD